MFNGKFAEYFCKIFSYMAAASNTGIPWDDSLYPSSKISNPAPAVLGKAEEGGPSAWVDTINVGDPEEAPCPWLLWHSLGHCGYLCMDVHSPLSVTDFHIKMNE